jgi:predicted O-linked N-acetylglucosamine transferase (SPINDLY family)
MAPRVLDPSPSRKLRIGYLGHYLNPLISYHDRAAFEIFNYVHRFSPLASTERFGEVRVVSDLSDLALARLIRETEIDILVDLSGHCAHNRLEVFARKPAPVQATWYGYYATTGLETIDWIIADAVVLPPSDEARFVERPWRLDPTYFALRKWKFPVPVNELPATEPGAVTFSNFNNLAKLSEDTLAVWARILRELPRSKLVMRTRYEDSRRTTLERFRAHGVRDEQIVLEEFIPRLELLRRYHGIDIGLDPFPYNGGTTTCEALYMGVPLVIRRGDRFVSRVGETIANAVGIRDLVADGDDAYVATACALARDLERLRGLRRVLRDRLTTTVGDPNRFMPQLENAYRSMWKMAMERP